MLTVSSKSQRHGSTRSLRRIIGPVSGIALALMLNAGVSARELRLDSPETQAVVQRSHDRMILMLKLRTVEGRRVLVYG